MSQAGTFGSGGGGSGEIITLTGNTGGAISPDGGGNINVVGDGTTATVVGNNSTHTLTISSIAGPVAVTYVNTSPYVVQPTDYLLDVDCSGGAITIQLPDTPTEGASVIVKDLTGSAATNNITVTTVSGGTNIDNATSYTISKNYFSIQITGNSQATYDIVLDYNPSTGGGVVSITGDNPSSAPAAVSAISLLTGYELGTNLMQGTIYFQNGNFPSANTIFLNTSDSNQNLGIGTNCMLNSPTTTFVGNTAVGFAAAGALTTGSEFNCFFGFSAGGGVSSGTNNCAFGFASLSSLLTGSNNSALGASAGVNLAGAESNNVYINNAGVASESNKLRIGSGTGTSTQQLNASYISGIQTIVVTGNAVLVSTSDQLGVAASSRRFKNDIQAMSDESSAIHSLRPVTFVWNRDSSPGLQDASQERQTGLIAEEVHAVMPNLVSVDKEGQPFTVKYEELPTLLLNELQKLKKSHDELATQVANLLKRG